MSGLRRPGALAAFALLACAGCIEDRLSVEITTQLHPDGSCSRRTEYRLERIDNRMYEFETRTLATRERPIVVGGVELLVQTTMVVHDCLFTSEVVGRLFGFAE